MRCLFYSHDGQGLGHVRRNLAIAGALTRLDPGSSVLVVSSTDHIDSLVLPPGVDILKLPGVRKTSNTSYEARRLPLTADETWSMRSALIASAAMSFRPDVLLADKHPLGAHGELRAALAAVRADGGRTVLGLRDILDDPATVRSEWRDARVPAAIADYDAVLVYGSRQVLDPVQAYGLSDAVASRTRFCGYVVSTPPVHEGAPLAMRPDGRPVVLATAGGGGDGYAVLDAFVAASAEAPWHPVVVSGTDATPAQQDALRRAVTSAGGTYHRFVRNLPVHFDDIAALVCMGGYNTTAEALRAAVPTVLVPRVEPRQEQLIRARAFAELGVVRVVEPARLHRDSLREAVEAALVDDRSRIAAAVRASVDLDGARRAALHLLSGAPARVDGERSRAPIELTRRRNVSVQDPVDVAV